MEQDLNEQQIDQVLYNNIIGHLGCHADSMTYVIPICYAYDGTCIYGRTYEGLKIQLLRKELTVCFQVDNIVSMVKWKSVIGWGVFEELTDNHERERAIGILKDRIVAVVKNTDLLESRYWPFSTPDSEGIIFCIHLNKRTGRSSDTENH